MRVVLIRPLYRTASFDPDVQESLAIAALGAVARVDGHAVLLLDPMLSGQSEETTARRAAAFRPDVVGFTAMSSGDVESIRSVTAQLNALCPTPPRLIVGGSLVSTEPDRAIRVLPAGVVCVRHEGETVIQALLTRWEHGKAIDDVPSLTFLDSSATVTSTVSASPAQDLDALPFPARDFAPSLLERGLSANIQGSRGCVGACKYCCVPAFRRPGSPPWRAKSPARIAEEMAALVRSYGVRTFNFVDDDFLGPRESSLERAAMLAHAIQDLDLRVAFSIQARPSSLGPNVVPILARAGLVYVFLGIEADDQLTLDHWGRREQVNDAWEAVRCLRGEGIEPQAGCILFHPDATLKTITRAASRLRRHGLLNYRTATNRLRLLPGSELRARLGPDPQDQELGTALDADLKDAGASSLLQSVEYALEPLRSPWVFAMSRLPTLLGRSRVGFPVGDCCPARQLETVRAIQHSLDAATDSTFFELARNLSHCTRRPMMHTAEIRRSNVDISAKAVADLVRAGMVKSPEVLACHPHEATEWW